MAGNNDEMFITRYFNVTPKSTEQHEAYVSARRFVLLKLTHTKHRAASATAELLVTPMV